MKHWTLLIFTCGTNARSKTGLQDICVTLDTQWMPYLPKIVTVLATGKLNDTLWNFLYSSLYHEVKPSAKRLGLEYRVTPYQTRHSGPSIDRACTFRTLGDIRQRGAWTSVLSVLRYDKSSKLAADYHAILARVRVEIEHTASRLVVCVSLATIEKVHSFMVDIAASRSSVCTAVSRFWLHLPPTAKRFPSAGWIRKTVRNIRDPRMIAGLVTLKHMSDAGVGASVKLITHLHKHTKPLIVSAPWRHTCWHMPVVSTLLQLPNVDLVCSQCPHGSSHRRRTGFLCGNFHEIDLSRLRPLCHSCSEKPCQLSVKLIWLDPRENLENPHRTRHNWLRRLLFCSLQPQDDRTYMHTVMVDDVASMLQWLMTVLPLIHKTLCVLLPRQKQRHLQVRTSRSCVTTSHLLVLAADHATCV